MFIFLLCRKKIQFRRIDFILLYVCIEIIENKQVFSTSGDDDSGLDLRESWKKWCFIILNLNIFCLNELNMHAFHRIECEKNRTNITISSASSSSLFSLFFCFHSIILFVTFSFIFCFVVVNFFIFCSIVQITTTCYCALDWTDWCFWMF